MQTPPLTDGIPPDVAFEGKPAEAKESPGNIGTTPQSGRFAATIPSPSSLSETIRPLPHCPARVGKRSAVRWTPFRRSAGNVPQYCIPYRQHRRSGTGPLWSEKPACFSRSVLTLPNRTPCFTDKIRLKASPVEARIHTCPYIID